uniref:Uncharacterized protein n=1 Tax=Salix viminalis TaxID=40686 RepID=A0A6N2KR04_SALVM
MEEEEKTHSGSIRMKNWGACSAITMTLLHGEYFVANSVKNFAWTAENGCDNDLSEKHGESAVRE